MSIGKKATPAWVWRADGRGVLQESGVLLKIQAESDGDQDDRRGDREGEQCVGPLGVGR